MASNVPLLDPSIFDSLKASIEEESQVRDTLTQIIQRLERTVAATQAELTRVHSTPSGEPWIQLCANVEARIKEQVAIVGELGAVASKHPYYKYNGKWTKTMREAVSTALFCRWLGGLRREGEPSEPGSLATIQEIGQLYNVPVNVHDQDVFHITLEEYLLAITDLTPELARLATNSVTLGDFSTPLTISGFIKDLFAGFQLLNLKNDILRRRVDAVKYDVKRVEDVVYDLSLRGLIKKAGDDAEMKSA
ncbi:hypothetical protein N3K66_005074 [Trichothecium roseum]|uniref:Uncharacterized protein n=1 Tax=Trichothecium roseum TaxID=47278 RepID=A0ACC0V3D7_9HYPO|nr:hypothetical protein N3K66_005074 [Trichothecium roseum]